MPGSIPNKKTVTAGFGRVTAFLSATNFRWELVALVLVASFAFFWRLGSASLRDWDEANYAEVSKEMVISGNWLVPQLGYQTWVDKPPLYMWSTALLYSVFGVGEFQSRVIAALSAIWLLILVFHLGRLFYGPGVGLLACLILLTSFQFTRFARSCMLDMTLSLFVYTAIYGFVRVQRGAPRWWYVVWGSFGLAIMVKSAAAIVIPLTIIPVALLSRQLKTYLSAAPFWWGCLVAIGIAGPWHLFMYARLREVFLDQYFGFGLLARSTTPLEGNSGDILFYVRVLRDEFSPWFYLAPFALMFNLKALIHDRLKSPVLLVLSLLILGLYTVVATKLPWYIIPAYPSLAILIAHLIVQAYRGTQRLEFSALVVGLGAFVVLNLTTATLVAALAGAAVFLGLRWMGQSLQRSIVGSILGLLLVFGISAIAPLYFLGKSPVAELAQLAARDDTTSRDQLIVYSGIDEPSARFYSNRSVVKPQGPTELASLVRQQPVNEIILDKSDVGLLSSDYQIQILAQADSLVYATIRQAAGP